MGKKRFKKLDYRRYECKLMALGCEDEDLLGRVGRLQDARRELVHEKAHREFSEEGEFRGELRITQDEAENARAVMEGVER